MEITLNLPENIYQNVSTVAKKSKRDVVDLIVDVVQEKYSAQPTARPLAERSDEEVLALANLQIPEKQSARHSELLYKNQAGTLASKEKKELDFFQQVYGVALSQKADGICEAIQRSLIKSPADLKDE
jgi:actin-related protein